jgi:hypothetical protein
LNKPRTLNVLILFRCVPIIKIYYSTFFRIRIADCRFVLFNTLTITLLLVTQYTYFHW